MPKRSLTKITKAQIDRLPRGKVLWDSEIPGFGVRSQIHKKSFVLKTQIQSEQAWITIGTYGAPWTPEGARREAVALLGSIARGKDPRVSPAATYQTVRELCARYLDEYAATHKCASSARSDACNIRNHVIPLLGARLVSSLSQSDIESFKHEVRTGRTRTSDSRGRRRGRGEAEVLGGPGAANRCLALLSKMLGKAEEWGLRDRGSNPAKGVERYPEKAKERYLSPEEYRRLLAALAQEEARSGSRRFVHAAIRLLMLTGARSAEVTHLRWDQVDLPGNRLRFDDAKGGRRWIPLSPSSTSLLTSLPRDEANPFVFWGAKPRSHIVNVNKVWNTLRRIAQLEDVRLHDLRHSFASVAAGNDISLQVIGALLGHKRISTTLRYAHLADEHTSRATRTISSALESFLQSRS